MSAEAIEWLESDERMEVARGNRFYASHQRPIFQLLTDHEWTTEGGREAMTELDIAQDAWGESVGYNDICGVCGHNPIVLGADGVDSA